MKNEAPERIWSYTMFGSHVTADLSSIHMPQWADVHEYTRADIADAQVAAAYERGVREAARHAASATGDVGLMNSILALIDYPTPDPDEQTKAQDLAFRKAVSS